MMPFRELNYSYTEEYKTTEDFLIYNRNSLVGDYEGPYTDLFMETTAIIDKLREDPETRRAILVLNDQDHFMSCLVSVQFLIERQKLYCVANFRSQHAKLGRPHDIEYLRHLMTLVLRPLKKEMKLSPGKIHINVADYHYYKTND